MDNTQLKNDLFNDLIFDMTDEDRELLDALSDEHFSFDNMQARTMITRKVTPVRYE